MAQPFNQLSTYDQLFKINSQLNPFSPVLARQATQLQMEQQKQQQAAAQAAAAAQARTAAPAPVAAPAAAPAVAAPGSFDRGGVSPVGVLEPFNDWQRQGLSSLAENYTSPWAGKAMAAYDQARDYSAVPGQTAAMALPAIQNGMREMTDEDFNAGISRYMNPYQQEVINRTNATINEQGDIVRNRLMGRRAGSNSFGDSSSAIQLAEADRNVIRQVGDNTANLNYQGYNTAAGYTRDDFNQARNRDFQGAGMYNQTAGTQLQNLQSLSQLAGLGMQGNEMDVSNRQRNITNKLTAGTAIQDQNQKMLDAVRGEYGRQQGYDRQQLSDLASYLGTFTGGTSTGATEDSKTGLGKLGGAGLIGVGGLRDIYNSGGFGSTPWMNPDTGRFV